MCGIVGLYLPTDTAGIDRTLLRQMCDLIRHRDPDDMGEFIAGPIGLGMRRLSIIDLQTGHQPISNEDGSIQVVYNGEIYNFQALQREAEALGHRFTTRTDTEVIVHLYEELGERVVDRLEGMFTFALWDSRLQRLLLARDRAGVKPLYYASHQGRFAFASEIRPLLLLPWVSRTVNPQALDSYLARGYVPAPDTMFRDVYKLPAAHRLVVEAGGLRSERYWLAHATPLPVQRLDELESYLCTALDQSVQSHLISDVPLGAFLSGGLDSSIVVALMRRHCTGRLKTFSIGINAGEQLNEALYARTVARHFETDHHELLLNAEDIPELLHTTAQFLDEPVSDPAAVPTYALAQLAQKSVKVVLTGEGADETWAGYYDVFRKGQLVTHYRRLPQWLRRLVTDPVLMGLPETTVGARFVAASHNPGYVAHLSHFDLEARHALYTPSATATVALRTAEEDWSHAALDSADPFGSITRDLLDSHLAERLLFKVDLMTMAHSVEARVPFLDHKLIEFAVSVPAHFKLRWHTTKYLLRRAFRDQLPPGISQRRKHGFDLPCTVWLRSTLAPLVHELFAHPRLSDFIAPHRMQTLWQRHVSGAENYSTQIWALMTLELWAQAFL